MNNITITNLSVFNAFLTSILKIVQAAEFNIDSKECVVRSINESNSIRSFLSTNSIISNEPITFCLNEVSKLLKCVSTLEELNKSDIYELKFDGTFILFEKDVKFKLKTIKREIIEKQLSLPLNSTLENIYGFSLKNELYRKLLSLTSISSSDKAKIYLANINGKIMAEIDDKTLKITDSIGIPISSEISGTWSDVICVSLDCFKLFNLTNANLINIYMTDKKVLRTTSSIEVNQSYLNSEIISSTLKV